MGIPVLYRLITPDGRVFPYLYFPHYRDALGQNSILGLNQKSFNELYQVLHNHLEERVHLNKARCFKREKKTAQQIIRYIKDSHEIEGESARRLKAKVVLSEIERLIEISQKDDKTRFVLSSRTKKPIGENEESPIHINGLRSVNYIIEIWDTIFFTNGKRKENIETIRKEGSRIMVGSYRPPLKRIKKGLEIILGAYNTYPTFFPSNIEEIDKYVIEIARAMLFTTHFLILHPFYDGNGRTSRTFELIEIYHKLRIPPISLKENKRNLREYQEATRQLSAKFMKNSKEDLAADFFFHEVVPQIPVIDIFCDYEGRVLKKIKKVPEKIDRDLGKITVSYLYTSNTPIIEKEGQILYSINNVPYITQLINRIKESIGYN